MPNLIEKIEALHCRLERAGQLCLPRNTLFYRWSTSCGLTESNSVTVSSLRDDELLAELELVLLNAGELLEVTVGPNGLVVPELGAVRRI